KRCGVIESCCGSALSAKATRPFQASSSRHSVDGHGRYVTRAPVACVIPSTRDGGAVAASPRARTSTAFPLLLHPHGPPGRLPAALAFAALSACPASFASGSQRGCV